MSQPSSSSYPPIGTVSERVGPESDANATSPVDRPAKMGPQYLACFAATLGSFVMGTAIGWSGPALSLLTLTNGTDPFDENRERRFEISLMDQSLIASLMPLGALLGGLMGGYLISVLGRHGTMYGTTVAFALFYLLMAGAETIIMILVGRFLTGVASGVTSIAAPVYIAETSSASVRGMLGSCFQVMVTLGVMYVDVVGAFGSWRWLCVACVAMTLVWAIALFFVPESPAYLLSQKRFNEARLSLQFLRGHEYIETELGDLQITLEASANNVASFKSLATKGQYLKPLLISMVLMFGQQLSGVNAVLFFSVNIFEAAGTSLNSFIENIILAGVQVFATILAALFIDRLGRRILLIFSALVMSVAAFGLGTYFWILSHDPSEAHAIGFLPLSSLCVFIFAFSVGFGPIPWLMMGELFGPEVKEKASTVSACFNWSLAFCVTQFYSPLANEVGKASTFWGFASVLVIILLFCIALVPETKGRTLEEIQDLFRSNQSPGGTDNHAQGDLPETFGPDERSTAPLILNADLLDDQPEREGQSEARHEPNSATNTTTSSTNQLRSDTVTA